MYRSGALRETGAGAVDVFPLRVRSVQYNELLRGSVHELCYEQAEGNLSAYAIAGVDYARVPEGKYGSRHIEAQTPHAPAKQ